jgi:hypothetical protein
MNQAVTILGNDLGQVITASPNNPEYGWIRLSQMRFHYDERNFFKPITVSTFLKGKVEDLQMANFKVGQTLPGKIVIKESLVAPNPNNAMQDMKIAGKTGIACLVDDQPIYRSTYYSTNVNVDDVLIAHTNTDEIKAAMSGVATLATADLEA